LHKFCRKPGSQKANKRGQDARRPEVRSEKKRGREVKKPEYQEKKPRRPKGHKAKMLLEQKATIARTGG
jgi:hypothetical protein